jgi:hypothetical protein
VLRGSAGRGCALLLVIAGVTIARPALADDRETAAVGKITLLNRKAVDAYQHLEFDTALRLLNEALEQSERAGLTQHPIRARTFVTLGIVTLGGFKQRDAAVKYFGKALQIQPEVRLSPGLANPEIQSAFDEAIAALTEGAGEELPPDKALVHQPVRTGQAQQAVPITVVPDKDLGASAVVLRYRAATAAAFTDLQMKQGPTGAFEAAIPASATIGDQVAYFIEARRANGSVLVERGTAADPFVVTLARPAAVAGVATTDRPPSAMPNKRFHFAILGGTGFGWASGTGEATRNDVVSSGMDWTVNGQIAPEIGYLVTPRLMLGVQARLQMVRGATPYHVPDAAAGECGDDNVCAPSTGAFAALLKATAFLAERQRAFQPYVFLSAGAGTIRHVSKVASPPTCGGGGEPCVDTVAGGPALFGPGFGFQYRIADAIAIVAEIGGLVGLPNFTANADVNVGAAFRL